ncbi:MAG TPA: hypothetical protein PLH60_01985, partial [Proteiniphilum sp.]|nr:hypothetical protein [Proteiniphilum sp.]HPJ49797.1 hypothetical protein [Proteiniphilum sp.]HPR19311.1 hypothetical protein [Proteiniphilum sp.]
SELCEFNEGQVDILSDLFSIDTSCQTVEILLDHYQFIYVQILCYDEKSINDFGSVTAGIFL